jgi:hypothetical protein
MQSPSHGAKHLSLKTACYCYFDLKPQDVGSISVCRISE